MGGKRKEISYNTTKLSFTKLKSFLPILLAIILFLIVTDPAGAGVLIDNPTVGFMGNITTIIDRCKMDEFRILPPPCRTVPKVESSENLVGLGSISTGVSQTTKEGDTGSASASFAMVSATDGVQITGSFSGSVNAIEMNDLSKGILDERLGTHSGAAGDATLIMDITEPTLVTIEIKGQFSLDRTGRAEFAQGNSISTRTFSSDGKKHLYQAHSLVHPRNFLAFEMFH